MKQLSGVRAFSPVIACIAVGLGLLALPGAVQAACPLTLSPTQNVENPNAAFDTAANVVASFNYARRKEGCDTPLSIDLAYFDAASPQQQMLILINAERQDRGLGPLKPDATLLSQIALNHARELFQYNYYSQNPHSSPINAPNMNTWDRIDFNPAIRNHKALCCAENISPNNTLIVPGGDTAALSVYSLMYHDAYVSPAWGHRHNILGYATRATPVGPGRYNWIGIGIEKGGGQLGTLRVLNFFEDSPSNPYTPPSQADTQPPSMSPPTIIGGNKVQVTNVKDSPDGSASGVAGVTGVVFYVGSIGYSNGSFTTVSATNQGNGVWQADLPVTDVSTLHAVAVDGSGNYTDCAGNASGCGTVAPPLALAYQGPTWLSVGNPIQARWTATGGRAPYTFTINFSLPEGLSLSRDGVLSGTIRRGPNVGYGFGGSITATDSAGASTASEWSLVLLPMVISVVPNRFPDAVEGQPYSVQLSASGGTPPYTWPAQDFPNGLSLNANGVVSGTPNPGTGGNLFVRDLNVIDANGNTGPIGISIFTKYRSRS